MFNIWSIFQISSKNLEKVFCFLDNSSWIGYGQFFLLRIEYLSLAVNALTNTAGISDTLRRTFSNSIFGKAMQKFDQSAAVQVTGLLNMLTVASFFETRLLRHLTNHIFCSLEFWKYITYEGHLFSFKMFKPWCRFPICSRKLKKKILSFLVSCSWIGCSKFLLLRREYLLSAVNVLTNTLRVSDKLRRTFPNTIFAKVMKQYDESAVVQFFRLFNMLTVAQCCEARLFWHLTNHIFRSL